MSKYFILEKIELINSGKRGGDFYDGGGGILSHSVFCVTGYAVVLFVYMFICVSHRVILWVVGGVCGGVVGGFYSMDRFVSMNFSK